MTATGVPEDWRTESDGETRARFTARNERIRRRQRAVKVPRSLVVPIIGGLLVLVADAQALALVPLQGTLVAEYGLNASQAAWTLSATLIATAAAVPTMTRMGDRFGLRRMLLVSLGIVTAGQALCAVAGSFLPLIIGRSILGFSAAVGLLYALIREGSADSNGVNKSMGVLTSATGGGIAISFLFGGAVLEMNGSVSTMFWITTVLCALVWVLSHLFVEDSPTRVKAPIDLVGGVLLGIGLVAVVLGVDRIHGSGFVSFPVIFYGVLTFLSALFWVIWEVRAKTPMIDVRILIRREVWPAAAISGICNGLGLYNSMVISGYVQTPESLGFGMGATPLLAGVYLLPISIPIAFGGFLAAPIIRKFGERACMIGGSVIILVNQIWFTYNHSSVVELVVAAAVFGAAYSVSFTAALGSVMSNARRGESGMLSSITSVSGTVTMAIAPAIVAGTLAVGSVTLPDSDIVVPGPDSYTTALLWSAVLAAIMFGCAVLAKNTRFASEFSNDAISLDGNVGNAQVGEARRYGVTHDLA